MSFSFTAPEAHYYLWHLDALGVIGFDTTPAGGEPFDPASPLITRTLWDRIPGAARPALVALVDVGVSRTHPNLAGRIDTEHSIDLVTHRYGAQSVPPVEVPAPYVEEGRKAFFAGLDLAGLELSGLAADGRAWLDDLVGELGQSSGVVRTLIDTDDTFGTHGTAIAGLVVGAPALAAGASMADILLDKDEIMPTETVGVLPYFGVDPLSRLLSIRTSFEQDAAHFITAFLYAWKSGADVILVPRGIPDPVRGPLPHKPELESDLHLRRNWERADLLERLKAVDTSAELRPHAVAAVARRDIGWDVLAQLIVAISKQVPIICAAGNDGESQLIYPANLAADDNGIVAVGAVSALGRRSGYSNYGSGLTLVAPSNDGEVYNRHQIRIDRTNPMVEQHSYIAGTAEPVPYSPLALLTTDLPGSLGYAQGGEPFASIFPPLPGAGMGGGFYTAFGGTSGAAALVGGVAALAARAHKTALNDAGARLTGPQMKALLVGASSLDARVTPDGDKLTRDPMNADDETNKPMSYFFGAGLVDAGKLVASILPT